MGRFYEEGNRTLHFTERQSAEDYLHNIQRISGIVQTVEAVTPAAETEAVPAPPVEEHRDPLAPAYQVGDTVYLDGMRFVIAEVRDSGVQLSDTARANPIFRSESKETFERLLWRDERNSQITDYLSTP